MQIKVKYVNNGFAQLKENEKNFLLNAPVVVKTWDDVSGDNAQAFPRAASSYSTNHVIRQMLLP